MREIIFRGKSVDKYHHYGEWVYVKLFTDKRILTISDGEIESMSCFDMCDYQAEVDPTTIGQYTGLTDKNGVKIFEGDVVSWCKEEWGTDYRELVTWDYELLDMRKADYPRFVEVIGNIHDNPELMEGEI